MSAKKKVFKTRILPLILLAMVAGAVFLYLNFGNLAKGITERIASDALGVKVRISSLDVSLADKKVFVNGLTIANPPGYKNAHAITVEKISIGLNNATKELIDFDDIQVEGSVVNLEVTPNGNNLTDLKNLAAAKPQKESVGSEQIRVIVQKMVIGASTLNPSVTLYDGSLGSIQIPAISLSGLGQRENGILAKDAITQVITKYLSAAQSKANNAGFMKGKEEIEKMLKGSMDGALDGALGGASDELKNVGKSIGGMFGK